MKIKFKKKKKTTYLNPHILNMYLFTPFKVDHLNLINNVNILINHVPQSLISY